MRQRCYCLTAHHQPLTRREVDVPEPEGTQVLVRVLGAGVCHSDIHIWEGEYDLGSGRKLVLQDRGLSLPLVMGHEIAGEVAALGPAAEGLAVGDKVLVYPWIGCGKCATCLAGDENMCLTPRSLGVYCDGGYADHMTVPHPRYLIDLRGLDPVTAAPYACSGVTTYGALKKIEADLANPIVIFGAGGLGLMALSLLKAMGGKGAIVVDIDARKREAAEKAGALASVDGAAPDALAQRQHKRASQRELCGDEHAGKRQQLEERHDDRGEEHQQCQRIHARGQQFLDAYVPRETSVSALCSQFAPPL